MPSIRYTQAIDDMGADDGEEYFRPAFRGTHRQHFQKCRLSMQCAVGVAVVIIVAALVAAVVVLATRNWLLQEHYPGCNGDECSSQHQLPAGQNTSSIPPANDSVHQSEALWSNLQLPRSVVPLAYTIELQPNISTLVFRGYVKVRLICVYATSLIVLHARHLNASSVSLTKHSDGEGHRTGTDEPRPDFHVVMSSTTDLLIFEVDPPLSAGTQYTLSISYSSSISSGMSGMYVSHYREGNTAISVIASQMEPDHAREVFPCFDEPSFKATFSLSIVRERGYFSLSNSPLATTTQTSDGLEKDTFNTSMKMSTYLLAFVVCDFANLSRTISNGKLQVSIYAPRDDISAAEYALQVAADLVPYYEDFFGLTYPLSKLDLVALPDFEAGAMENWGLITFRSLLVLFDNETTSTLQQREIINVISHELAHQWFGNLVTMSWWDDLWLNEGFATYVSHMVAHDLTFCEGNSTSDLESTFVLERLSVAMELDSLCTSHPIQLAITQPAELSEVFDDITYSKGSSVLRMLQYFFGKDCMKRGMAAYLNKYQYSNAKTSNLWQSLHEVCNSTDVGAVMTAWTSLVGYPVITVSRNDAQSVMISQERFLLITNGSSCSTPSSNRPNSSAWPVPFTFFDDQHPESVQLLWLFNTTMKLDITTNGFKWIKGNVGQQGYYRVNYDPSLWAALVAELADFQKAKLSLSPADRFSLLDDAFALMRSYHIGVNQFLDVSTFLMHEADHLPLVRATEIFETLLDLFSHDYDTYKLLQKYTLYLLEKQLNETASAVHASDRRRFSPTEARLLQVGVSLQHPAVMAALTSIFEAWVKSNGSHKISPDLRGLVFSAGLKNSESNLWDRVWYAYIDSPNDDLQAALAQTTNVLLLQRYLDYSLDTSKVRSQDTVAIITAVARSPYGALIAFNFLRSHWSELLSRYGSGNFLLPDIVRDATRLLNTPYFKLEALELYAREPLGVGEMAAKQALETLTANVAFVARTKGALVSWLSDRLGNGGKTMHSST